MLEQFIIDEEPEPSSFNHVTPNMDNVHYLEGASDQPATEDMINELVEVAKRLTQPVNSDHAGYLFMQQKSFKDKEAGRVKVSCYDNFTADTSPELLNLYNKTKTDEVLRIEVGAFEKEYIVRQNGDRHELVKRVPPQKDFVYIPEEGTSEEKQDEVDLSLSHETVIVCRQEAIALSGLLKLLETKKPKM